VFHAFTSGKVAALGLKTRIRRVRSRRSENFLEEMAGRFRLVAHLLKVRSITPGLLLIGLWR
jgi:hypothetical protein